MDITPQRGPDISFEKFELYVLFITRGTISAATFYDYYAEQKNWEHIVWALQELNYEGIIEYRDGAWHWTDR